MAKASFSLGVHVAQEPKQRCPLRPDTFEKMSRYVQEPYAIILYLEDDKRVTTIA